MNDIKPILRLRLPVIAVIAEKKMKMHEVLNLSVGSIVQLDKPAEDLLDLMVNDRRIGRGETVRIGENFGLQIAELGSVKDTIRKLGGQDGEESPPETATAAPPEDTPAPDDTPEKS